MRAFLRFFGGLFAFGWLVVGACGGKTIDPIDAGEDASPAPPASSTTPPIDSGGRNCPQECVVGHQCCQNGCGGLPVAMPSSCCSCLPGEVGSETCGGKCGG